MVVCLDDPATPMLDKMSVVSEKSQAIGEFLDWLQEEKEYSIRELRTLVKDRPAWNDQVEVTEWLPIRQSTESLIAEFFGIDMAQADSERRVLLERVRQQFGR